MSDPQPRCTVCGEGVLEILRFVCDRCHERMSPPLPEALAQFAAPCPTCGDTGEDPEFPPPLLIERKSNNAGS